MARSDTVPEAVIISKKELNLQELYRKQNEKGNVSVRNTPRGHQDVPAGEGVLLVG